MKTKFFLDPSGYTWTASAAHKWCGVQVARIKKALGNEWRIGRAHLWAYLHEEVNEYLILSFNIPGDPKRHEIAFAKGNQLDLFSDSDEIIVPDLVVALHLAGIITRSLGICPTVGRGENEVNEDVLRIPLVDNKTNGPIKLFK